jgi:hypothetical protein
MAKSPSGHAACGGLAKTADDLILRARRQEGWNFYICMNPSSRLCTKPAKEDILALSCLGLDLDPPASGVMDKTAMATALTSAIAAMTDIPNCNLIVDSGRGLWAWILIEPLVFEEQQQRDKADAMIKGFVRSLATQHPILNQLGHLDTSCAELSRLARCPGTTNLKTGQTAEILIDYFPMRRVPHNQLFELAQPYIEGLTQPEPPSPVMGNSLADIAPHMNLTTRQFCLLGIDNSLESRHTRLFSAAKNLFELKVSPDLAEFMLWSGAGRCRPDLNRSDPGVVRRIVKQVWRQP